MAIKKVLIKLFPLWKLLKVLDLDWLKIQLLGRVNGRLVDASDLITEDSTLQIITPKDQDGVEIIRHSCAHLGRVMR